MNVILETGLDMTSSWPMSRREFRRWNSESCWTGFASSMITSFVPFKSQVTTFDELDPGTACIDADEGGPEIGKPVTDCWGEPPMTVTFGYGVGAGFDILGTPVTWSWDEGDTWVRPGSS